VSDRTIVTRDRLRAVGVAAANRLRATSVAAAASAREMFTGDNVDAAGAAVVASTRKMFTRERLQACGVAAACAFAVGLSAAAPSLASDAGATGSTGQAAAASGAGSGTDAGTAPAGAAPSGVDQVAGVVAEAIAPAPAAPAAPSDAELHPVPVTAAQQTFTPDAEQLANAKAIVDAGKEMNLPPRAWTIAVATSLQESNLRNLGHLGASNDHDSLGLFQQRPSSGWGTPAQVQNPNYAAKAFYAGLVQVPNWDTVPLTVAAQKVQVSAYPNHYAKHEVQAGEIIDALYGTGPYADVAANVR
jgi:hypothetical protein